MPALLALFVSAVYGSHLFHNVLGPIVDLPFARYIGFPAAVLVSHCSWRWRFGRFSSCKAHDHLSSVCWDREAPLLLMLQALQVRLACHGGGGMWC